MGMRQAAVSKGRSESASRTGGARLLAVCDCGAGCVRQAGAWFRLPWVVAVHRKACSRTGQMTVELAIAFPVLLVVAVIAVNALTFISDCAVFDRIAHEAVRVHAASPAYRQGAGQTAALIEQEIRSELDAPNLEVGVSHESAGADFERYTATLEYSPTLFGMGVRTVVFGVSLPRLTHKTEYVIDTYKPGVVV